MNIERLKIITGSPKEVQEKAQAYLDNNTCSRILSSSITMKRGPLIEAPAAKEAPKAKTAKKQAANAADKPAETPAETPAAEPVTATLQAVEYGPDEPVVCLVLGREL